MAAETFFYILTGFAFALGAVIGSFLNVVAYRLPQGLSVVFPGSRCPCCETPIRWYDNIPIVSWFLLDAQCRHCEEPISARYVFVEGLMGFLATALWIKVASPHFQTVGGSPIPGLPTPAPDVASLPWGPIALVFGLYFAFLALLVVISLVDVDHYLIPHEFTLPGMALGVIAALLLNSDAIMPPASLAGFWPPVTVASSLIGLIGGGLAVILLFYLYFALRGIAGLGGGDVTMMALVGAWLGWPALIFVFFAASIQGLIAAGAGTLLGIDFLRNSEEILSEEDPRKKAQQPAGEATDGAALQKTNGTVELDTDCDEEPDEQDGEVEEQQLEEQEDGESDEQQLEEQEDGEVEEQQLEEQEDGEGEEEVSAGGLAVPFGPFIALSAIQFFFLGEFLPDWLSLSYLYLGY